MYKDTAFTVGGAPTSEIPSYCLLGLPESVEEMPQNEEDLHLSHPVTNSNWELTFLAQEPKHC